MYSKITILLAVLGGIFLVNTNTMRTIYNLHLVNWATYLVGGSDTNSFLSFAYYLLIQIVSYVIAASLILFSTYWISKLIF